MLMLFHVVAAGIDLPVTDMVFMTWSDHSFSRNDQRAGRCLRLHGDKEHAVIAVWGRPEDMTGLLELAYGAQQVKAVTQCIENTDAAVEAAVSDSFRTAVERQMQADLTGVEFKYAEWAQLCSEYTHLTGQSVKNRTVHAGKLIGYWADTQKTTFQAGKLSLKKANLCRKVGITLERTRTMVLPLNDEQNIQFLTHCVENNISTTDKQLKVNWMGAERIPQRALKIMRRKWDELDQKTTKQLENLGFTKPVSNEDTWSASFQAWKSAMQNGTFGITTTKKEYRWQYNQREDYKNGRDYMTSKRIAILEEAGFKWKGK